MASISVVKPGFSTFGVEVASSTSSAIKFGSLGSPTARRVRGLGVFSDGTVAAFSSFAGASTPAAITSSFLSALAGAGATTGVFSSTGAVVVGAVSVGVTGASALSVVAGAVFSAGTTGAASA